MTHLLLPGFLACGSVFECDQAFGEGFVFEEGKFTLWEAAGKERAALADQHGNDSNIKLVDYVVFEEVASEFAAPHQPDVFSRPLAELLNETSWGLVDKGDAVAFAGRLRMRENVALHFRAAESASTHFESIVVGLGPQYGSINGGEKRAHRIVLGHEEKIERAIGAGDVPVDADAEPHDELPHDGHS